MGNTDALRQLLRSLCENTHWKYAVFWKLDSWNHMQLSWEDAYFDNTESSVAAHNRVLTWKSGIISFGSEVDAKNKSYTECPIKVAVTNMSSNIYILGEGIIGNVASRKKYQWIFAGEYNSKLLPECHEEYQLQFAAGIKTILLVHIAPLGVVQLGSLHQVMENPMMAAHIRDLFSILQHIPGTCISHIRRLDNLDPYTPIAMPRVEDFLASSALSNLLDPIHLPTLPKKDITFLDFCQLPKNESSNIGSQLQAVLPLSQDVLDQVFGTDVSVGDNTLKATRHGLVVDTNQSIYPDEIIDCDILKLPRFVDELNVFSAMNDKFIPIEPVLPNYFMDGEDHYDISLVRDNMGQKFEREFDEGTESIINERYLDFPFHSELHKVIGFGLGSLEEYDDHLWNAIISKTDELNNAICHTEAEVYEPLVEKTSQSFIGKSDTEQLLDAIIADLHHASEDVSDISRCSCSNSSETFPDSCLTHFKTDDDILGFEDSVPSRHKTHASFPKKEGFTSSAGSLLKSTVSLLSNDKQHIDDMVAGHGKVGLKSFQRSKKRGRSSDSRRLRPRDRQLIQDRLKELRELIPEGSKCSIDVLLDRTVNHMLFLQSIPCRAEKLRQLTYPKIRVDSQNSPGTEVNQNGASWAYEVEGKPQVCPLIVENLDQPGQMLVEMLCKEYGLFLEIVQVIKCLKLTILKGVLESRSDELWAHFIIEGSRGFYRMDILLPLMQLLQRN